jgi:hypothetical protein
LENGSKRASTSSHSEGESSQRNTSADDCRTPSLGHRYCDELAVRYRLDERELVKLDSRAGDREASDGIAQGFYLARTLAVEE